MRSQASPPVAVPATPAGIAVPRIRMHERNLLKVKMPMFEALMRGYSAQAAAFLTLGDEKLLPSAGTVITFEILTPFSPGLFGRGYLFQSASGWA